MTLRWGIVCAGKISHDWVNAFNSYPMIGDQKISAVAARDLKRANEFAKLHNIEKFYGSYEAMAASHEIDVVYIGALNPEHYKLSKMFLESGKHVLCEKPLCLNYKQALDLVNTAKRCQKFLMEAIWSRFSPAYIALEKEINSGKLGHIKFVEVDFGLTISNVDRVCIKELGGSVTLDLGVYVLQFAQLIFKEEPTKVTTVGDLNDHGVDTSGTIILEYKHNRRAVLNIHSEVKLWNRAIVAGTMGQITLEDPFHFPLEIIHFDGSKEQFPLHTSEIPYNFNNSAGLVYEAIEVNRCIKQGLLESPRLTHADSLELAKLEDTVRKQLGVHFEVDNF